MEFLQKLTPFQWVGIAIAAMLLFMEMRSSGGKAFAWLKGLIPSRVAPPMHPPRNDHGAIDDLKCLLKHFKDDPAATKTIRDTVLPLVIAKELEG